MKHIKKPSEESEKTDSLTESIISSSENEKGEAVRSKFKRAQPKALVNPTIVIEK